MVTTPRCHSQVPKPQDWVRKQLLPTALPAPLKRMGMGESYGNGTRPRKTKTGYLRSSSLTVYETSQERELKESRELEVIDRRPIESGTITTMAKLNLGI